MKPMKQTIVIGGGKGGVGKSTVTMAVLDALRQAGYQPIYVETDDSNPDVFKAVRGTVACELCSLDDESGYICLGDLMERNKETPIVVNTPARATPGLIAHGGILCDVAKSTGRRMVMVWALNRQRDGLELLKQFVDAGQPYEAIYALLNTYFGSPDKFARYHASKLKDRLAGALIFPELNDLVTDQLVDQRLPLWADDAQFTIAQRSVLGRFRAAAHEALKVVYEG